jgi:hypothetical protein
MVFLKLLLGNWQLVAVIALLAAMAGTGIYIKILKGNIETCEAEKKTLVAELEVSQASVKGLQISITEQNTAIEKLKSDADAREKAAATEIAKAKATSAGLKKQADDLLKRTIPQNTTACDAANQLFNEEIRNAK